MKASLTSAFLALALAGATPATAVVEDFDAGPGMGTTEPSAEPARMPLPVGLAMLGTGLAALALARRRAWNRGEERPPVRASAAAARSP